MSFCPRGLNYKAAHCRPTLAVAGPTDKLIVTGPIRLSNSKLAGFDLGSKLSAVSALSGRQTGGKDTTIQNFSTTVRVAPEGTQAERHQPDHSRARSGDRSRYGESIGCPQFQNERESEWRVGGRRIAEGQTLAGKAVACLLRSKGQLLIRSLCRM